jgi:hypothetical protein
MSVMAEAFMTELMKMASVTHVVERAIGGPGSPLRKALARAALLGAGTTAVETAIAPADADGSRHYVRNLLAGGAAGAVTGRSFPGWFGRASMTPSEWR